MEENVREVDPLKARKRSRNPNNWKRAKNKVTRLVCCFIQNVQLAKKTIRQYYFFVNLPRACSIT